MLKGNYRFILQRTMEVRINVVDSAAFQAEYDNWLKDAPDDPSPEAYLQFIALLIERGENPIVRGTLDSIEGEDLIIEAVRTCRHCGCTENTPCRLGEHGCCAWADEDVCTNPTCLAAAELEKEVEHG